MNYQILSRTLLLGVEGKVDLPNQSLEPIADAPAQLHVMHQKNAFRLLNTGDSDIM